MTTVGLRREVGLVQRHGGTVQIDLAPNSAKAGADRSVEIDYVGLGFRIGVTDVTPGGIGMEGAADTG